MAVEVVESTCVRLKRVFDASGLKQIDLVEKTGIDKSSISLYLSGKVTPKGDKLFKLSLALNVDAVWLAGFDVPMRKQDISTNPNVYLLSEREQMIVNTYRDAPIKEQLRVDALILEISDAIEKKNSSSVDGSEAC